MSDRNANEEAAAPNAFDTLFRRAYEKRKVEFAPASPSVLKTLWPAGESAPAVTLENVDRPAAPADDEATGRYRVLGEIGRGGMGVILRGRDTDLGREVAIKVLGTPLVKNTANVRRFVEEAQIAGQLQHPGIVPVYELGTRWDRKPYFTMKLVKGKTLAALLDARANPTEGRRRFLSIFEKLLDAVAYAHARGVVHRDLKPANIMVGAFGEVQVMDWGLAKVLGAAATDAADEPAIETIRSDSGENSVAGTTMGTPGYMAPEQAIGAIDQIDERADVFSLGAILFHTLVGEPLVDCEVKSLTHAWERLRASDADRELIELAIRCLALPPADRPRDARALAEQFGDYLAAVADAAHDAEMAAARADEAEARAKEEARARYHERRARKLTLGLAASILFAVIAGALGYVWFEKDRATRQTANEQALNDALATVVRLREQARITTEADGPRWDAAVAAAENAASIARASQVGDEIRGRVRQLTESVTRDARAAAVRRENARRDDTMVRSLANLELHASILLEARDRRYRRVFTDYGLDLDAMDEQTAVTAIRDTSIAAEIAAALDEWALLRRMLDPVSTHSRRLARIARASDPDPARQRLRDAALARDSATLQSIAASEALIAWPVWSKLRLARALEIAGDAATALRVYRLTQRRHPAHFLANMLLAHRLEASPATRSEALHYFNVVLALKRRHVGCEWDHLIRGYLDDGKPELALATAEELLRRWPESDGSYNKLGLLYQRLGRFDEAVEANRKAVALSPKTAGHYNNLANTLRMSGDAEAAVAAARKAIELNPEEAGHHVTLGVALHAAGHRKEAIDAVHAATRLAPEGASVHYVLADLLAAGGEYDAAREAIETVIAITERPHPRSTYELRDDQRPYATLGFILLKQRNHADAAIAYQKALATHPDRPESLCNLGLCLVELGRHDEALSHHRRGHALGTQRAEWPYPSETWLARCERLVIEDATTAIAAWRDRASRRDEDNASLRKAFERLAAVVKGWTEDIDDVTRRPARLRACARRLANAAPLKALRNETTLARLPVRERIAWRDLFDRIDVVVERLAK